MEHISRIVYINLGRRPGKGQWMERLLKRRAGKIPYERFEGIWPTAKDRSKGGRFHEFQKRMWNFPKIDPNSRGILGCYLSHYFVHKKALEENWGNYLVLEDDVGFGPHCLKKLERRISDLELRNKDWDIFRSTWRTEDRNVVTPNRLVGVDPRSRFWTNRKKRKLHSTHCGGTHFQLINSVSTEKILDYLDSDRIWNIDSMYSTDLLNVWQGFVGAKPHAEVRKASDIPKVDN